MMMPSSINIESSSSSTKTRPSLRHRVRQRWGRVVVVATFALYFVLYGILFSYNVLFVAFQQEFGSSATLTGWVGSIPLSVSLMLAPFIKLASERFGYRSVSVFGIVLASAGIFVTSFLPSLLPMFGTYGLMGGVGAGVVTVCALDLTVLYFPEKNTMRAVAITLTGSTIGMLSLTQIMALLITHYGWRITLRIMGGLLFVVGLPCVLTYTLPSNHHGNSKKKNKYCKVTSDSDISITDRVVETLPGDPHSLPSNGLQHSPSKMDTKCDRKLIPRTEPAYKVVDGLGEDSDGFLKEEDLQGDDKATDRRSQRADTATKEQTVDDRSLISGDGSEHDPVIDDEAGTALLDDDGKHDRQLTMNFDESSQTPRDESNGVGTYESRDTPMNQLKNFQHVLQSCGGSTSTAARLYYHSDNHNETSILEEVDTMMTKPEESVKDLPEPGMLWRIGRALTFPELWLVSVATILNGIGECFYYVNAISYLVSVGFTEQTGVKFMSFTALSILGSKVCLVFIGDYLPFPRIFLTVISNVISICLWISLMVVRSVIPAYCIAGAVGITLAITNVVVLSLAPDFFGQERVMETSTVLYFCYGTGYLLGSLVGQSIDNTGSYKSALWAFIGMYVASVTMLIMAPLYQRIFAPERFVTFEIHRRKREAGRERGRLRKNDRHGCLDTKGQLFVCEKVSSL